MKSYFNPDRNLHIDLLKQQLTLALMLATRAAKEGNHIKGEFLMKEAHLIKQVIFSKNIKIHRLKTIQPYFDHIISGKKDFEVRKDDRCFKVGDRIDLFEGDEQVDNIEIRKNKNHVHRYIKYKLDGGRFGLVNGYCILGLTPDLSDIKL